MFFFLLIRNPPHYFFFFFNDTATTEIYTLSLHDALPIFQNYPQPKRSQNHRRQIMCECPGNREGRRSEEHTSELQSLAYLVCRLLLEKKKKTIKNAGRHTNKNAKRQYKEELVGCKALSYT